MNVLAPESEANRHRDAGEQCNSQVAKKVHDAHPDKQAADVKSPIAPYVSHDAIVPRLRFAWRCKACRRILMRHHMPLAVISELVGPLEAKCHCNAVNRL
jgi:hypothetical protein